MQGLKQKTKPLTKEEFQRIGVGEHPVTVEQVVLAINGKLASGDYVVDCFKIMYLPYYFGEVEVREAAELFVSAGWRVDVARNVYVGMPEEENRRDWRLWFT